jgi:hypothetical protein
VSAVAGDDGYPASGQACMGKVFKDHFDISVVGEGRDRAQNYILLWLGLNSTSRTFYPI